MFEIFAAILILALGIAIGYAIGVARIHWPLINWFRSYYNQRAEARMRQHTQFLIAQINLFGAAPVSHRSAATRVGQGGRHGSRLSLLPVQSQREGGDAREYFVITTHPRFVSSKPSTGASPPDERP